MKKNRRGDLLTQSDSCTGPVFGRGSTSVETTLIHVRTRMTSPSVIPSQCGITHRAGGMPHDRSPVRPAGAQLAEVAVRPCPRGHGRGAGDPSDLGRREAVDVGARREAGALFDDG